MSILFLRPSYCCNIFGDFHYREYIKYISLKNFHSSVVSLIVCREMKIVQDVRGILFVTVLVIRQECRAEPQVHSRFIRSSDSGVYGKLEIDT